MRYRMLVRRARIVAFLIFGLSGGADANQEGKDMKLEDMGFVMRAAYAGADRALAAVAAAHIRRPQPGPAAAIISMPIPIIANACSSATNWR
jgi:hypothetical protein